MNKYIFNKAHHTIKDSIDVFLVTREYGIYYNVIRLGYTYYFYSDLYYKYFDKDKEEYHGLIIYQNWIPETSDEHFNKDNDE